MNQTVGGTMFDRREIVLIPFPYSDLTGAKHRPALVISNDTLNSSDDRICCLVTSNRPKDGLLISNKSLDRDRLPFKSWVKPHRIFTIHKGIVKKRISTVTESFHNKVVRELNEYLA